MVLLGMSAVYALWLPVFAGDIEMTFGEVYVERESGPLAADLYVPGEDGLFPGVLVVHGGAWHMGTRAQLSGVAQMLARQGFTAVAISYRLAPDHKFPAQIEDCRAALSWMCKNAERLKLDATRIGGFGYSAGAQLVALLGTSHLPVAVEKAPDNDGVPLIPRLQAVVGGGAPCDFRQVPLEAQWLSFWLGGSRKERSELYRIASPAAFVSADDPPMFFFHGGQDERVPLTSPQSMCQALRRVGVPAELYVVPHVGHIMAAMDHNAIEKSIQFLTHQLSGSREP